MQIAKWFTTAEWWTIQVVGTDSFGQPKYDWAKDKDITGRLRQLNASEKYSSNTVGTESTHRFYTEELGISNTDRIKVNNIFYDVIRSNNVMNFGEFAQVDCKLVE